MRRTGSVTFTVSACFRRATRQDAVTFTSQANLVVIDVSVKDKSGKVMPDLKKGDFTILEDGKPQQVSVFEFQKLDSDTPPPPVPAAKEVKEAPVRRGSRGRRAQARGRLCRIGQP